MNKMKTWMSLLVTVASLALMGVACSGCDPKNGGGNDLDPNGATGITLSATEMTLMVNETKQLTAVLNAEAKIKFVTWSSDNESVVSVTPDGTIAGISEGKAKITASAGSARAVCKVQVKGVKKLEPIDVTMTGEIDHETHTPGQSGSVSFNRFPASVAEFKEVREKIGKEPQGAVALEVMAMEMYRRDRNVGTECLKWCNTSTNTNACLGQLKETFGKDVNYARPYQMAAFLEGATPDNGYKPNEPYTVTIDVRENRPYEYSKIYQANVLTFWIHCGGARSGTKRSIQVVKTAKKDEVSKDPYFVVFNCPDLYTQVEEVSFKTPFEGLK